jgi:two-component system sensor histidine kinase/response regulator
MSGELASLLIVDDNELNRDLLVRRLARQGYETVAASSGAEALRMIEERRFDLALFDIMMPEISGLDALAKVRETYSLADLPVIIVTAKSQSEDIVEALRLGANDYVTKPIDFPVLLARVQAHLRLRRLSALKDEFMRMASHDLKNPLTEVLGVASLVESMVPPGQPMPREMHALIGSMKTSARRMQHIIEDFLDFQILEDGAIRLALGVIDLAALTGEIVAANSTAAGTKQISLTYEAPPAGSIPPVLGDERRLGQCIQNFVDNAVKFTPKGGRVQAQVRLDGGHVLVEVQDSGPGLSDDDFSRVFRKYARLTGKPTGGETSSGVGLSIVKRLVERHEGGRVGVRNAPEGGAVFWLELPAGAVDEGPV